MALEKQHDCRIGVTFDLEHFEYHDLTYQIFKDLLLLPPYRHLERVGIVVQAYLRPSQKVLQDLAEWSQKRAQAGGGQSVKIRLVKGAYWDFETIHANQTGFVCPVFHEKWMSDVNYERCCDVLVQASPFLRASLASHNIRSLSYGLVTAQKAKVPCRVEMLYGMSNSVRKALVDLGVGVSVYSPVGPLLTGMAYLARRILENASQGSFLRQSQGNLSLTQRQMLLQDPQIDPQTQKKRPWPPLPIKRYQPQSPTMLTEVFQNEPLINWSVACHRQDVQEALERLKSREQKVDSLRGSEKDKTSPWLSLNPSSPDLCVGALDQASVSDVKTAVSQAQKAFLSWSETKISERAEILLKAAHLLRCQKSDLIALMMHESGKPLIEADADVAEAIDFIEAYARDAFYFHQNHTSWSFKGRGVAAVISPWNFPLAILTGNVVSSLMAGNTVVMKPAEQSPLMGQRLWQILQEAGVPKDVVHLITGGADVAQALLAEEAVRVIQFVGSTPVGLDIYESYNTHKTLITEMGGKNALIVDEDAHPDDVIDIVLKAAFGFAGQKCSALDRLILVGSDQAHEKLLSRLVEAAAALKVGPPDDFGNTYGPVIDQKAYDRLQALIQDCHEASGVSVLLDGRPTAKAQSQTGYFLRPTILKVSDFQEACWRLEFFGPVLAVATVKTLSEALSLANDSLWALTAGLITRHPHHRHLPLQAGDVYIDRAQTGAVVKRQPFGGYRLSGTGPQAGGSDYLWRLFELSPRDSVSEPEAQALVAMIRKSVVERLKPVVYQPDLLGESNTVRYHAKSQGVVVLTSQSLEAAIIGLLTAGLVSGNSVILVHPPALESQARALCLLFSSEEQQRLSCSSDTHAKTLFCDALTHWVAFGSQAERDGFAADLRESCTSARAYEQGLVKAIIAESHTVLPGLDPSQSWQIHPGVLLQMAHAQTRCENTSRHGYSYKE